MNIFYSNTQKDKNRISNLLSMNCAGWNPIKLWKYKQFPYVIKTKKRNWMILKIWGRKWMITKFLVWKILLKSYHSLFHLDSNILASIYENAKAKWRHYFQYPKLIHRNKQMYTEREWERERFQSFVIFHINTHYNNVAYAYANCKFNILSNVLHKYQ